MKIAIYGAGAIGALLGAKLHLSGEDVTLIARGPHLKAMQTSGLTVVESGETITAYPSLSEDPKDVGPVDYLFITVKTNGLEAIAENIPYLCNENTAVVTAQNGIPWWYFYGLDSDFKNTKLNSLDPKGIIESHIENTRVIGCIVYPSAIISNPGVVTHLEGDRFSLGEPDGSISERCKILSAALIKAGFKSPVRPNLRNEIWVKLMGNIAMNPISMLTRGSLKDITEDSLTRDFARNVMLEAELVATALGVKMQVSVDQRLDGANSVGEHKTSMLQDYEQGRPIELESIIGSVVELADILDIKVPNIKTLYGLSKMLANKSGIYL
ncbi:MAG: 2-dehydropantoate 2-reductase [Dehalococcoidia bacterium]